MSFRVFLRAKSTIFLTLKYQLLPADLSRAWDQVKKALKAIETSQGYVEPLNFPDCK